jgi:uncharacterized membrane protein YkoI
MEHMKKRLVWVGVLSAAVLIGSAIGASAVKSISASGTDLIGREKAKAAALQVVDGKIEDIDLEREGGRVYYDVEIETKDRVDYDVWIDAHSGAVLHSRIDDDDDDRLAATAAPAATAKPAETNNSKATAAPSSSAAASTVTGGSSISADQAGKIAAADTGGKVVKVEKDRDDGSLVYEVKLSVTGGKAEVEVDASTGKITEIDNDRYDDNDDDDDDDGYDDRDDMYEDDNDDDDDDDDNRYDD